ncbi:15763_t:CDS:2, partial [Funneliformis mosseae]
YWLLDIALKYSKSQFIGVDKISISHLSDLSLNVNIEKENAYYLSYEDETFAIFPAKDKKDSILPETLRILKPERYIELQEFDYDIINLFLILKNCLIDLFNLLKLIK